MSASSENIPVSDHPDSSTGGHTHFSDSPAAQSEGVSRTRTEGISRTLPVGIGHSESSFCGSYPSPDSQDTGPELPQLLYGLLAAVKRETGSELCTIDRRVPLCLADSSLDGPDPRVLLLFAVQVPASSIRAILRDHLRRIERRSDPVAGQSAYSGQTRTMSHGYSEGGCSSPYGRTEQHTRTESEGACRSFSRSS